MVVYLVICNQSPLPNPKERVRESRETGCVLPLSSRVVMFFSDFFSTRIKA